MSEDRNPETTGIKALGQEMLDLGTRCLNAGTQWLNQRRNEMANEYEHRGNRQQDFNQTRHADGRNGRLQASAGGRYHGTDYDDPRAEYEQSQGASRGGQWDSSAHAEQRYGTDYSESGGSRGYGQGQGRRDMQAGRFGGYASEDESLYGMNQQGAREFANEQYGQGMRGQGGQSRFGQGGSAQRAYDREAYGPSAYGQGSQGRGSSGQGSYGQRPYDQGEYNQSGYGRGDFAEIGAGHGGDARHAQSLGNQRQGGYGQSYGQGSHGQGSYGQGSSYGQSGQADEGWGSQAGHGSGGYGTGNQSMGGQQGRQSHRGKGPRNYSRSDERITEDLNERLMQDDDIDATHINVSVSNGEVTLEGTVEQRWMKHRIEDLAERCSGVKDVENRIRVKRSGEDENEGDRSASSSASSSATGSKSGTTNKSTNPSANPSATGTTSRTSS